MTSAKRKGLTDTIFRRERCSHRILVQFRTALSGLVEGVEDLTALLQRLVPRDPTVDRHLRVTGHDVVDK